MNEKSATRVAGLLRTKRAKVIVALLGIIAVLLAWGELTFRLRQSNVYSQGNNAIWLRHSWVGKKHSPAQYRALAKMFKEMEVSDAYFHVGPLDGDGTIRTNRYPYARDLARNIKKLAPRVRIYAWLGQVEALGGGPLDLASAKTRQTMIRTASDFLDLGFDGIHYDVEPIVSGDRRFIALLRDTHKVTRSRHRLLSVAASKPEPFTGVEWLTGRFARNTGYWQRSYFVEVAKSVDQVAVMTYDTGTQLPSEYGKLVSWTTRWSVEQGLEDVRIGIPTYGPSTLAHQTNVENMTNGLIGLKNGLANLSTEDRKKVGAAIYAEWTTDDTEQREYRRLWTGH
jgi:hypothetical protein